MYSFVSFVNLVWNTKKSQLSSLFIPADWSIPIHWSALPTEELWQKLFKHRLKFK